MRIWQDILDEQDKVVLEKTGYGRDGPYSVESQSLGKRPVCLVIDMQRALVGRNVPVLEAIDEHRPAMGEIAWKALDHIVSFVASVRQTGTPLIYTRTILRGYDLADKALEIVPAVAPEEGDVVLDKRYTSAFYGTLLSTVLVQHRADTVITVGNSTSGCIRGTAVDAQQHGYCVIIPEECVFDRIQVSHKVALMELWMKTAQVLPAAQVVSYLEGVAQHRH